jgi:hypothetical protein
MEREMMTNTSWITDTLIKAVQEQSLYRLALFMHKHLNHFSRVIHCYLKDDLSDVFDYLKSLAFDDTKQVYMLEINGAILENVIRLMKKDAEKMTNIIAQYYSELHGQVLDKLMRKNKHHEQSELSQLLYQYLHYMMQYVGTSRNIIIDESLQYQYIKLMCQFDKSRVASYLTSSQQQIYNHPQYGDKILQYCEEFEIPEAVSFLYERRGEVSRALDFVLQKVNYEFGQLKNYLLEQATKIDPQNTLYRYFAHIPNGFKSTDEFDMLLESNQTEEIKMNLDPFGLDYLPLIEDVVVEEISQANQVVDRLLDAIVMCRRNTVRKTLDEKGVRYLWFGLLDRFGEPLQQLRSDYDENGILFTKKSNSDSKREQLVEQERARLSQLEHFNEQLSQAKLELSRADEDDKDSVIKQIEKYARLELGTQKALKKIQKQIEEYDNRKATEKTTSNMHKLVNLWLQRIYLKCVKLVLFGMMDSVDVTYILDKVIKDISANDTGANHEFRQIIHDMLHKHKWDVVMSKQAYKFLLDDSQTLTDKWQKKNNRAQVSPSHMSCQICFRSLATKWSLTDSIRVFLPNCNHAYHNACLERRMITHCPLCTSHSLKTAPKKKSKEADGDQRGYTSFELYNETIDKLHVNSRMELLASQISNVENSLALLNTKKLTNPRQVTSLVWRTSTELIPPIKVESTIRISKLKVITLKKDEPKKKEISFFDFLNTDPEDLKEEDESTNGVNDNYFSEDGPKPKRAPAVAPVSKAPIEVGMKPVNTGDIREKKGVKRIQDLLDLDD